MAKREKKRRSGEKNGEAAKRKTAKRAKEQRRSGQKKDGEAGKRTV